MDDCGSAWCDKAIRHGTTRMAMPSEVVHWALGALIAAALLGDEFDIRSLGIVLAVTALPDLDTFIGMIFVGTHRAALHNLVLPAIVGAILYYDVRMRDRSVMMERFGSRGIRIAWVSLLAFVVAGIGLDFFWTGVNVFYPIHDRFYRLWGNVLISNQRGLVQTVWEVGGTADGVSSVGGTTKNTHYSTGVDPTPKREPKTVERIFPIAQGGFQLALISASLVVTSIRLWLARKA